MKGEALLQPVFMSLVYTDSADSEVCSFFRLRAPSMRCLLLEGEEIEHAVQARLDRLLIKMIYAINRRFCISGRAAQISTAVPRPKKRVALGLLGLPSMLSMRVVRMALGGCGEAVDDRAADT